MSTFDASRAALLLIDVQRDFMPGGTLACHEGDVIVPPVNQLLSRALFRHVVATQDWHPPGHVSFASSHAGRAAFDQITLYDEPQTLWPDHCVQGSAGAQLHPDVDWSRAEVIIRKGTDPRVDSYSAFQENHGPDGQRPRTGLAGWLRELGVSDVYLAGLARDVCVLWSAQDAVRLGFAVHFLWDLTRPVTPDTDAATRRELQSLQITIVDDASTLTSR